ncbi:MAG: class I adenylate-forming enzyme family protein [Pseudomonadota bacterium]
MATTGKSDWTDRNGYGALLSPPAEPVRDFIIGCCSYDEIYRLAGGLYDLACTSSKAERPWLCLCTYDKTLIMAALIASLAGGPRLVLPYAFSRQALAEVCDARSPAFFLADSPADLDCPAGPQIIFPGMFPADIAVPPTVCDPDEPFLILFTGGSTGTPKVWTKTPRNLFAEARYQSAALDITRDDIFLSTVPPNHIYGLLFSILVPFVSSARILKGIYAFPREILKAAKDYRATILVSVPVHYRVLNINALERYDLRLALSSAGMLSQEDALSFREKTGLDVVEVYGSTETGGIATRRRFPDGDSWNPINPVAWKIREGKLCVSSTFLSPTLPRGKDGFFMTADCVDPDGNHRFILRGRADDIVKIGGKRVDISAVQTKMKQIPGVRDAFVVAIPAGRGRQNELAALVSTDLDAHQVKRHLAQVSEAYAVPRHLVVVNDIPMTPAGKYERAEIDGMLRTGNNRKRAKA